jgi:hypothetical protein
LDDPLLERLRRALAPEFVVERRVAAGGMGIVYRARDVALDRAVAVKVLRPELATAVARERFLREARLLARLQHANIVPVHQADERDGLPFYVMDFIEGHTLADRLAAGPLPLDMVLRLARDLVEALAAAHSAGIVHRDVKPQNIFFVEHRALLGDFGIARDDSSDHLGLTEDGVLVGTREYMAPEQLYGEPATERSDQYSAAAVLYEAAKGQRWKALDAPARASWRSVPKPMVPLLQRALAVDPAKRWNTMREARGVFDRARFRRGRLPKIALLIAGAAVLVKLGVDALAPPPPPRDHRSLAVLPFTVEGAPADSLGREVAEVAYINLFSFPNLKLADFDRGAAWQRDHPGDGPAATARALDVTRAITGRIERRGDSLLLQLVIPDSGSSPALTPIRLSVANGDAGDLGRQAAIAIGMQLGARPGSEARNLASSSPEAVGQFMTGEALFDADAWQLAAKSYAGALAFDSSFALAKWRRLVARLWARESSWDEAQDLVACCADQLPPLEAGLVRAMSDTDLLRRFQAFDTLTTLFGASGSLPLLFASDLFHRGPLVGRGLSVSLGMFEQAIESSPGGTPAPAYDHMVWGKTRLGERAEAKRWLRAREDLGPTAAGEPPIVEFLALGTDLRWSPLRAKVKLWLLDHLGSEHDIADLARFFRFSAAWDLPEGQYAVGQLIASRLLASDRASGLEAQGLAQFTWGRVAHGLALIDTAATYFKSDEAELQRRQWRLLLPMLGAGRASEAEEDSARRWLRVEAVGPRFAARARWTLALDAIQRGDSAEAAGIIEGLAELGATDTAAARLAVLAGAILRGPGAPAGALAQSAALLHSDSPSPGSDIFTRSLLHLARARWFEALDRPEDAGREILWYENSDTYRFPVMEAQKMEVDAVASVAARVSRARILLAAGEPAEACPMLSRVRELWRNADASLNSSRAMADSLHRAACR